MTTSSPEALLVAELQARIAGLEEALEKRSQELRRIQRLLCSRDLLALSRLAAGQPPFPHQDHALSHWRETIELTSAEVDQTLETLWASLEASAIDFEAPRE